MIMWKKNEIFKLFGHAQVMKEFPSDIILGFYLWKNSFVILCWVEIKNWIFVVRLMDERQKISLLNSRNRTNERTTGEEKYSIRVEYFNGDFCKYWNKELVVVVVVKYLRQTKEWRINHRSNKTFNRGLTFIKVFRTGHQFVKRISCGYFFVSRTCLSFRWWDENPGQSIWCSDENRCENKLHYCKRFLLFWSFLMSTKTR